MPLLVFAGGRAALRCAEVECSAAEVVRRAGGAAAAAGRVSQQHRSSQQTGESVQRAAVILQCSEGVEDVCIYFGTAGETIET